MRSNFGSKIGMVLASAGSAVGLGNIWRFPTEAGRNGGAAFMLLYLACVLLLAMPVMIAAIANKVATAHWIAFDSVTFFIIGVAF